MTGAYQVKKGRRFCSIDCRREWYSNVWSKSEEWSEKSSKRAIKILENNPYNICSNIQIKINNLLSKLGILYKNEKGYKYYSIDNYLCDYNLDIENMGTYWHCDHRKYPIILYESQIDRIKRDKAKECFINSQYNTKILYLWETDITENIYLCELLINDYINNNGLLSNYHSFNYHIENDILLLNEIIEHPYMEWDIEKLNDVIDIKTKEKLSKKDLDKWTIFECDYCGAEKEELTTHYNKSKKHFCSLKCFNDFKKYNNLLKKSATSND